MSREEDEIEQFRRQTNNLYRDLAPLMPYFKTPSVTNIYVYGDGYVEIEDFDKGTYGTGFYLSVPERQRIINSLASISDSPIDSWKRPTLETIIPGDNIRTTAILPPWTKTPELTFRRPAYKIYTLEDYASAGRLKNNGRVNNAVKPTPPVFNDFYDKIAWHLENRSNIVISGSTGSGKTTFTNALIERMAKLTPEERFYVV